MEPITSKVRTKLDENDKTKLDMFITATSWLIGLSVGFTIKALISQNVETENKREDVGLYVGTGAIAWATKEVIRDKVERRCYEWVDMVRRAKEDAEAEIAEKHSKGK